MSDPERPDTRPLGDPDSTPDPTPDQTPAPPPVPSGPGTGHDFAELRDLAAGVRAACGRVLVGLEDEVDACLTALVAGGHVLLEGPPGVAKTLLVRCLAAALGGDFGRIQFTPDLMPADVTGTSVFHADEGSFRFRPGPIFTQFLLCDEINRAPAKTQAALLEAMQERAVTTDGATRELPRPFAVFATQNPIEHEGTYPLPEAQLDRFLFHVRVGYPAPDHEAALLAASHARPVDASPGDLGVTPVAEPGRWLELAAAVERRVEVRPDLFDYVVRLLGATRRSPSLALGASPRAGVMLVRAAKARAAMGARDFITPDDLKGVFLTALRHRVALDPAEEIGGGSTDAVLRGILDTVEVPR